MDDGDFTKGFEEKVRKTIIKYDLIKEGDKVLVAVSGGKDSTTVLYILHKLGYNVEGMIIDQLLGAYSKKNLENIKTFCKDNGIKLHVVHMRDEYGCSVCYMESVLKEGGHHFSSCTICGVIRRNVLNRKGRDLGFTKVVTGHNMDDEVQNIFMNFLRGELERCARLGPTSGVIESDKFIPRIKPLYFCLEKDVEKYSKILGFPVVYDPCPCSASSFRSHIKELLLRMEKSNPSVKQGIMDSFLKIRPALRKGQEGSKLLACRECGEPSSRDVCRSCEIINKVACSIS